MLLSSRSLVEINAIIVMGLLILLTFNFIDSGNEKLNEKTRIIGLESDNLTIQRNSIELSLQNLCPNELAAFQSNKFYWPDFDNIPDFNSDCKDMLLDYVKTNNMLTTNNEYRSLIAKSSHQNQTSDKIFHAVLNGFKSLLIIPFIASIVIEFLINRTKKEDAEASAPARIMSFIGFILLGIILSINSIKIFYSTM